MAVASAGDNLRKSLAIRSCIYLLFKLKLTYCQRVSLIILKKNLLFTVNLSVADTMVSTLNVIFSFIYMLHSHWPFGELYCKISQFISALSVCASVFSLMAISIDRSVVDIGNCRSQQLSEINLFAITSVELVEDIEFVQVYQQNQSINSYILSQRFKIGN